LTEHANFGINELAHEDLKELTPHAALINAFLPRELHTQRLPQLTWRRKDALNGANRVDNDVLPPHFEDEIRIPTGGWIKEAVVDRGMTRFALLRSGVVAHKLMLPRRIEEKGMALKERDV